MTNATLDDLSVIMAEAEGLGVAFSEELKGDVRDAGNPHYTIGVVGRFQVGKSTLVNRVFLRQPSADLIVEPVARQEAGRQGRLAVDLVLVGHVSLIGIIGRRRFGGRQFDRRKLQLSMEALTGQVFPLTEAGQNLGQRRIKLGGQDLVQATKHF